MRASRFILADVDCPPDTSRLVACDDAETAAAIAALRGHALLARARLAHGGTKGPRGERVIAAVRRLDSAQLTGYRGDRRDVLVSEPFNKVPCAAVAAPMQVAAALVSCMAGAAPRRSLVKALAAFGEPALRRAVAAGVRITIVPANGRFADHSNTVARLVPSIDAWPSPPAGIFVVEERLVLLRARSLAMTAAHEFAHALDAVLARKPRSYLSFEDERVRRYFGAANGFVNEYAASALDEYFAESVRAYLEINDSRCAWLPLTRASLLERDPRMFALIEGLFISEWQSREG